MPLLNLHKIKFSPNWNINFFNNPQKKYLNVIFGAAKNKFVGLFQKLVKDL